MVYSYPETKWFKCSDLSIYNTTSAEFAYTAQTSSARAPLLSTSTQPVPSTTCLFSARMPFVIRTGEYTIVNITE